jgi:hypothetical protein
MEKWELQAEIDRLNRKIDRLTEEAWKIHLDAVCPAPNLGDGLPHGTPDGDPLGTYAARLDDLKMQVEQCMYRRDKLIIRLRHLDK